MPSKTEHPQVGERPLFVGDVETQSSVTVNRKGGSLTAILKKNLADKLRLGDKHVSAATVDIGSGKSVLLMGVDEDLEQLQVIRRGVNTFEVLLADTGEAQIDPVAEAFLALKTAQFERGWWDHSGPLTADDVAALGAESFEQVEQLLKG